MLKMIAQEHANQCTQTETVKALLRYLGENEFFKHQSGKKVLDLEFSGLIFSHALGKVYAVTYWQCIMGNKRLSKLDLLQLAY